MSDYVLDVTVHIRPLWTRPVEATETSGGAAETMRREQVETRYAALGYELARWLREQLGHMDDAERAETFIRLLQAGGRP